MGSNCMVAAMAASIVVAASAHATLAFTSNPGLEGLGAFTGTLAWSNGGGGTGTLVYTLTNTSQAANGGFLTGFAFNTVDGVALALTSAPAGWSGMSNVSAVPFANLDFGAALGGDWLGGGSPNAGIAVGGSATFTFSVSGGAALLATLVDGSFFDAGAGEAFAARFRGFANGGSDKVTGTLPAPGGLAAMAVLAALPGRRRR